MRNPNLIYPLFAVLVEDPLPASPLDAPPWEHTAVGGQRVNAAISGASLAQLQASHKRAIEGMPLSGCWSPPVPNRRRATAAEVSAALEEERLEWLYPRPDPTLAWKAHAAAFSDAELEQHLATLSRATQQDLRKWCVYQQEQTERGGRALRALGRTELDRRGP